MWVHANNDRSGKPIRYFEYQPDRSGKHAAAFLKGFSGCLVTDGYAGYNQVDGVIRCGCWSHMRRYWREAMPKGATKETSKAAWGYDYCNKLFALEKKFFKMSDVIRKTARQVEAEPLLEAYWWWLETLDPVPGSKLADAVTYAKNQKKFLNAFLEHGEVDISNKQVKTRSARLSKAVKHGCSAIPPRAQILARSCTPLLRRPKQTAWIHTHT